MTEITLNDRLAIHALVDRLVADGSTFDANDARELVDRLPLSAPSSAFQFQGSVEGRSNHTGYASGIGQTHISDKDKKTIELGKDNRWRIGGYKIEHSPGTIEISLLWEETRQDSTGQACRLIFEPGSRRPIAMHLSRDLSFTIWRLHVNYARVFDPWKVPA